MFRMRAMTPSNHRVFWFHLFPSLPPPLPVGAVHLLHRPHRPSQASPGANLPSHRSLTFITSFSRAVATMAAPNAAAGLVNEINVVAQGLQNIAGELTNGQNAIPQVLLAQVLAGQQAMQLQMQQGQQAMQLQMANLQLAVQNMEFNSQRRVLNSPAQSESTILWLRNDAGELPLNPVNTKGELTRAGVATVNGLIGFYHLVIPPGTSALRRRGFLIEFLGMRD